MKTTFSLFLLMYSQCGALASWAARHTTVCLNIAQNSYINILYTVCTFCGVLNYNHISSIITVQETCHTTVQ